MPTTKSEGIETTLAAHRSLTSRSRPGRAPTAAFDRRGTKPPSSFRLDQGRWVCVDAVQPFSLEQSIVQELIANPEIEQVPGNRSNRLGGPSTGGVARVAMTGQRKVALQP